MYIILLFCMGFALSLSDSSGQPTFSSCDQKCDKYNIGFDPFFDKNTNFEACLRGCRFYIVADLLGLGRSELAIALPGGITTTNYECHESCSEAYNKTADASIACKEGCDAQEDVNKLFSQKKQEEQNQIDGETSLSLMKPLMQIREISSKVFGMMRVIQSSVTMFFMKEDDQTVVAVKGPTQIRVEIVPEGEGLFRPVSDNMPEVVDPSPETVFKENYIDDGLLTAEQIVGKADFQEVTAIRDVPEMSLALKYAVTTGLAIMVSICLALVMCMFVSVVSKKYKNKEKMQLPPSPYSKEAPMLVKVIRTEDLTKLSIMEEDEKFGMRLPESSII